MCGIAGMVNRRKPVDACEITRMSDLLEHRGPDDSGQILIETGWNTGAAGQGRRRDTSKCDLGMANRRLAILDLSVHGHQPMTREGRTIVYNGEVYNYIEIRSELSALGVRFESSSDTEVILQAYIAWGIAALDRFNGIFAFAIWNEHDRTLLCARDRLGVKPFYYVLDDARFIFASEIRSILAVLDRRPDLNEALVYDFLAADHIDHTDETFFTGVKKLPAGSYMLMSESGAVITPYWTLGSIERNCAPAAENVERFRELFTDAVRLQMRSDVPIACCLSGGMDSSAIVSVASRQTTYPMETFTARYADKTMDEYRYADAVVRKTGVRTTPVVATPAGFWQDLPRVLRTQEEPFGGPSIYSQWLLMKTIRGKGVKVVLDGQGGDELLCGYAKYFYYYLFELWSSRRYMPALGTGLRALSNAGAHIFNVKEGKRYLPSFLKKNSLLLRPELIGRYASRDGRTGMGNVRAQQELDVLKYSIPVLLRFEDKNSMAHSVESRVPFLDHRLVEFSLGLPTDQKLYGAQAKLIMRKALGDVLPREILHRRSKLGFGGSFASWVRELTPQLTAWAGAAALPVDRFVRREALSRLLERGDPMIFRPLVLDRWMNEFGYTH